MGTAVVTSSNSITSITGYKFYSGLRLGSNGDDGGDYEYMIGSPTTVTATGREIWDDDPQDVIQSSPVAVSLVANAGGGTNAVSWTVSGGGTVPILFSGTYGAISAVKLRVAATVSLCKMTWSSIVVNFYKAGVLTDTVSYGTVEVDTLSLTDPVIREKILTITPSANDNTKVEIMANVVLEYDSVDIPDPNAEYSQVYVFAA